MNRDIQKLLKEKWFLVAADLTAVIGILSLGLNPKDGFEAFLAVVGILGASLIVVIPVLKEGSGKSERLAEQARLRTALAEEIDRLREDFRAGTEAVNRRVTEVELTARKNTDTAVAAVAQRASTEINALKASLAECEGRLQELQQSSGQNTETKEAMDDLGARVQSLANAVRGAVADVEEITEAAARRDDVTKQLQASAEEVKTVRDEIKKAAQKADRAVTKVESSVEALQVRLDALAENPPVASAPSQPSVADDEPEAELIPEKEIETSAPELELEDEPVTEVFAASPASGGTSLIVNLMIGIGNKPFVRGSGPGLSPDKGIPMSFLGIGRWQWISPDAEAPATVEIWKNDQAQIGEPVHLSGGEPVEIDESHFSGA